MTFLMRGVFVIKLHNSKIESVRFCHNEIFSRVSPISLCWNIASSLFDMHFPQR